MTCPGMVPQSWPQKGHGPEIGVPPRDMGPETVVPLPLPPPPPPPRKGYGTRDWGILSYTMVDKLKTLPSVILRMRAVTTHSSPQMEFFHFLISSTILCGVFFIIFKFMFSFFTTGDSSTTSWTLPRAVVQQLTNRQKETLTRLRQEGMAPGIYHRGRSGSSSWNICWHFLT